MGINKTGRGRRGGRVRSVFATFLLLCAVLCAGCGQAQPTPGPSEPTRAAVTEPPAGTDAVQATATSEPESASQPAAQSPAVPAPPGASPGGASPPAAISVPPPSPGPPVLEEQILRAAVIARVRLRSVSAAPTQRGDKGIKCSFYYAYGWLAQSIIAGVGAQRDNDSEGRYYNNGIVYTFDVIEYLKGEGDGELVVLEPGFIRGPVECRDRSDTEEAALEAAALAVERRDTRWEDREAIIFVQANFHPNQDAAKDSYPYEFMRADPDSETAIATYKEWLPAAEAGGGTPVLGQAAGAMRFLSATPDSKVAKAAAPRTLAELRTLVAEAVENYRTGSAEHGEEAYNRCLREKYRLEGNARWGEPRVRGTISLSVSSGAPAGTRIKNWGSHPKEYMSGNDAYLFSNKPTPFFTTRPIPLGEYRFYHIWFDPNTLALCGGPDELPESLRESREIFVHVTAPEGVLHEAFFDPVASGEAVGAGGDDGVLKPASFTLNGSQTTMRRIEWESGRVVMRLEPDDNALADHHVDFIALDGSVALRLDFDDAAQVTNGGAPALAWGVCNQPWSDGDLLMLRIRESEANLSGATRDADCPATATTTPSSD